MLETSQQYLLVSEGMWKNIYNKNYLIPTKRFEVTFVEINIFLWMYFVILSISYQSSVRNKLNIIRL